jgi:hypothetical protein
VGVATTFLLLTAAGCGGGGDDEPAAPAAPTVPTTVFGRQAKDLAVGVAAQRRGQKVSMRTTVIGQDGTMRRGLGVALQGNGAWVPARPCGAGRYCGDVAVRGARPQLHVRLTRPAGGVSTLEMRLPASPQPERAAARVRASAAAFRALRSVIVDENLGSGPPYPPLITQFNYVAPDRLSYRIAGAGEAVVIGTYRWDRENDKSRWQRSRQEPVDVPTPDWRRVLDASVLGTGMRDGRPVDVVSFYDPTIPAWFEAEFDRQTDLPLRLRMTAAAHFMTHRYGGFNAPITILPPT